MKKGIFFGTLANTIKRFTRNVYFTMNSYYTKVDYFEIISENGEVLVLVDKMHYFQLLGIQLEFCFNYS